MSDMIPTTLQRCDTVASAHRWTVVRCRAVLAIALAACLLMALASLATAAPADDLLQAWEKATDQPSNAKETWKAFAEAHAAEDVGQLARLQLAMTLWREKAKPADILPHLQITEPKEGTVTELRRQLVRAADAIEARVRMVQIAEALQSYFAKHIEYPDSLDALVAAGLMEAAQLRDPFGQPWGYETAARRLAPDLPRQRYTLTCTTLKVTSRDIASELKRSADDVREGVISSVNVERQQVFMKWQRKDGSLGPATAWTPGNSVERYTLWAVHEKFILLGDAGFPKLLRVK